MIDRAEIAMRLKSLVNNRWPGHGGQRLAADALGVSESQMSWLLSGKIPLSYKRVVKWAGILGVPVAELTWDPNLVHQPGLPFRGSLHPDRPKATLGPATTPPAGIGYPIGSFTVCVSGHDLAPHRIFDGDLLTVQPCKQPRPGSFVVAECRSGVEVLGYGRGRYYRLTAPVPAILPKTEIIRVEGIVVQRCGSVH